MGLTHQAITVPQKRQFTNENTSNQHALPANHTSCEKGFCDEDCSCEMQSRLQKRSRDLSPQRKPLGVMEMLPECHNGTKKTEVVGLAETKRRDPSPIVSITEAMDAALLKARMNEGCGGGSDDMMKETTKPLASSGSHGTTNYGGKQRRGSKFLTVYFRRGSTTFQSRPMARQQPLVKLIKPAVYHVGDESEGSECSTVDISGSDDQGECQFDTSPVDSSDEPDDDVEVSSASASESELESKNAADDRIEANMCSGIRPSLFPFVPPFINFCQHTENCDCLPKEVKTLLKWRLSPITPTVVRETVTSNGFRLMKNSVEWTGQWGKHMKAAMFRAALKDYQKLNHLPGTFQVGRKDKLWRNYQRFSCKFGKENFGFLPKSYILPQEMKSFKLAWDSSVKGRFWIIKPPAGARGNGIRVINRWEQVPKKRTTIVQKYISHPFLINSRKFDIRVYVLVTSFHPLKIFLYREGLVRFAPIKYSSDSKRVSDRNMHLTNYSINKHCDLYTKNEDADSLDGHKWTLTSLWGFLETEGHNVGKLWNGIEDIAIKTFVCAEDPISACAFNMTTRYNGYELFGLDIILDDKLKPWLLEVNISPSLHSSSPLDLAVKGPLIREVFNIVGYHFPDFLPKLPKKQLVTGIGKDVVLDTPVFDKRLYATTLSSTEKAKQCSVKGHLDNREKYLKSILRNLTPDDVRYLVQAEDELSQCVAFKRLFPTATSFEYLKFLEGPRYYNVLLDAWENKYGSCRSVGIKRLQQLCTTKMHLQVVPASGKVLISVAISPQTMSTLSGLTSSVKPAIETKDVPGLLEEDATNGNVNITVQHNDLAKTLSIVSLN